MLKTSLRYFMAVARQGSIRGASFQLNVAQSAVGRQIEALEHQLGVVLLERQTNGVSLTEAGQLLYEYGRKIEFDTDGLRSELSSLNGFRRGHIRIFAIELMVSNVLPRAIGQFRERYPGITFAVEVTTSEHIAAAVRDGAADIGLGLNTQLGPEFQVVSAIQEPLVLVVAPPHPLATAGRVTLADVTRHQVALAARPAASRMMFDEACRKSGMTILPALETNSVHLAQQYAQLGHGLALLLRHTTSQALEDGALVKVDLDPQLFAGTIDIFTYKDRTLPAAVTGFLPVLGGQLEV